MPSGTKQAMTVMLTMISARSQDGDSYDCACGRTAYGRIAQLAPMKGARFQRARWVSVWNGHRPRLALVDGEHCRSHLLKVKILRLLNRNADAQDRPAFER